MPKVFVPKRFRYQPEENEAEIRECQAALAGHLQKRGFASGGNTDVSLAAKLFDDKPAELAFTYCHAFIRGGLYDFELWNYPHLDPSTGEHPGTGSDLTEEMMVRISRDSINKFLRSRAEWNSAVRAWHKFLLFDDPVYKHCWWPVADLKDALLNGVIVNDRMHQAVAMQAITLSRVPYEYPNRVLVWYDLVQNGVHPRLALIISHCVSNSGRGPKFTPRNGNHDAFALTGWSVAQVDAYVQYKTPWDLLRGDIRQGYREIHRFIPKVMPDPSTRIRDLDVSEGDVSKRITEWNFFENKREYRIVKTWKDIKALGHGILAAYIKAGGTAHPEERKAA